jgi:hypothetical protein
MCLGQEFTWQKFSFGSHPKALRSLRAFSLELLAINYASNYEDRVNTVFEFLMAVTLNNLRICFA